MSDEEDSQLYRSDMSYRSLRRTTSQVMGNIKKKLTSMEDAVRSRRALAPLNESFDVLDAPDREETPTAGYRTPVPKKKTKKKEVPRSPSVESFAGCHFDAASGLMKTPFLETPAWKPIARTNKFRKAMSLVAVRKPSLLDSPSGGRLSKQLARCRIFEIQSPRRSNNIFKRQLTKLVGKSSTPKK